MKRRLIALLLAGTMALSLAACGSGDDQNSGTPSDSGSDVQQSQQGGSTPEVTTPDESSPEVTAPPAEVEGFGEAPMLADLVSAGSLPAVEDRLPVKDDVYVEQVDAAGNPLAIGTYGGVINLLSAGGSWGLSRPVLESIIHYNSDGSYYANVIKSFEHNDDYTVWTFHLREGMKWSDGDDFNADDITFWYYMCHLTNYDTKKSWAALKETVNGEDAWADLKKVDDYTVTWTFVNPKFPADFIESGDFKWCWAPSHYLLDMIPDSIYVENPYWEKTGLDDEAVLKNAQAKGIDAATVSDLGKAISYYWWNEDGIPCLNSYVLTTKEGNNSRDAQLCILERNPYFWKVDASGQQLPYCDEIHFNATSESGQDQLMFRSGELDIIGVSMQDISSLLADLGDAAQLRTFAGTDWGSYQVTFNYTCKDANYATLFADSRFRQAMSICVDREQVSGLLSDGFLEPGQCAPAEGNFGYDAEWETKWTEYDVDGAKALLEECGLVMGSDGFYDFADGTDLVLTFYAYTEDGKDNAKTLSVLEQYYNAAGIKCALKEYAVDSFDQEIDNNDWYAILGPHTPIGGLSLRSRVQPFVPIAQSAEWYGEYGTYYGTGGAQGVAPEGDMAKLVEIYEKWNSTPDVAERDQYTLDIYALHKENLWTIAYLKTAGNYNLISSKIQNYPDLLVWDDLYQYQNLVHYWTLFKAE